MIFGGAALVTGLIIGGNAGTVIAVGGALVGLYGLYVYLGRPTGMGHGDAASGRRISSATPLTHRLRTVVLPLHRSAQPVRPFVVHGLSNTT